MVSIDYQRLLKLGHRRVGECFIVPQVTQNLDKIDYVRVYVGKDASGKYKNLLGHRISYETWKGQIPDGYTIDHVCHNEAARRGECMGGCRCMHRRCVNPAHLEAKTHHANMLASPLSGKGKAPNGITAEFAAKTHCPQGHPYTSDNLVARGGRNGRDCLACARESTRIKYAENVARGLTSNGTVRQRPYQSRPSRKKSN